MSLCARVLRAKYYPTGDILNCQLKKGSSYVWQSIWSGIQTFKKGYIWRVGNGEKINIWDDCWIPNSASKKVLTVRGNQVLTKVNELIDPITGEWDEMLIRENFWHIDAERILQIPLFHVETEDYVAWHLTRSGVFSVRSAYYKQWEVNYDTDDSGLARFSMAPHPVWKKLWSLRVPAKVKIYIWRCLHNAIPCRSTLMNRHVGNLSQCPYCTDGAEDLAHMLFKCARAQAVWEALGIAADINFASLTDRAGSAVLEFILCDDSYRRQYSGLVELPELISTVCWFLWWQRRQFVRGEEILTPERTAPAVVALAINYVRGAQAKSTPKINRWPTFLAGQLVLNVDASFTEGDYAGSCGAVIRDHRGSFMSASTARLEHVADVFTAEAAALLEGLKLARDTGCNNLVVRSDNITVVDALRFNEGYSMVAAPVLDECRSYLVDFGRFTIEHCIRESNYVAHELARWGRANNPSRWIDAPPDFIVSLLADDISVL